MLEADRSRLENDYLRVELDDRGLLSSIFDKSAGRQVLAPGARGNRFQLHPDYPNFFDAWDIDRFAFDQVVDLDEVESVDLVEQGPLRAGHPGRPPLRELPHRPGDPAGGRVPRSSTSTPRWSGTRRTGS